LLETRDFKKSGNTLPLKDRIEAGVLKNLFYFWSSTVPCRVYGKIFYDEPVIYVFWHCKMFGLIRLMRNRGIYVLASRHRDGEKVVQIVKNYGYRFVRGSTSRGGIRALREVVKLLKEGRQVAFTPDGPRGPRWKFQEGALFASRISGVPIVFVGVGYTRKITLPTWDLFEIPLPFSGCVVYSSLPYSPGKGDTAERLGSILTEYTLRAEAIANGKV